jgi:hypothetical protein
MSFEDDTFNDYNPAFDKYENNSKQKIIKQIKPLNKEYHNIKITYFDKNNKKKIVDVGVYSSGPQNSLIRNAETGEYYKYKVGTYDEDLFFKVVNSTGELSSGPITLFYNSPEHYEKHQYIFVSDETKKTWEIKKENRLEYLKNKK